MFPKTYVPRNMLSHIQRNGWLDELKTRKKKEPKHWLGTGPHPSVTHISRWIQSICSSNTMKITS
ncbi:hypothetical protein SERLA73DRAFT_142355 [Serpula lacrymans var. lacrymans S7.3]|uniref:Uncharacterized protein n=2 Tax=Serpula lacrymans var. lacrymans TaxID=341189 RepID=F8Q7N1_SERL3|nr:uncharacterized protein SERLADRAFT_398388 [Serpula lacrymans var. lacrymans S7.9]EGN95569.1 hypothetical protein SERLA73DRAFT_142355 [Serpula lacrymans var. lacrymans S7.3]EGO21097.1 hypothetical protein SERLADRAFT_398388 [Serpula lacrymans var. lacrymans S7.9]